MNKNKDLTDAVVNAMNNPEEDLQLELPIGINWEDFLKCDCGTDTVGSGKHSDYCSKYRKENE